MKKIYSASKKLSLVLLLFFSLNVTRSKSQTVVQTFTVTGTMQSFTVPACVTTISVDVRGAQGANAADKLPTNSTGGMGGRSTGLMSVTQGQVLNIFVGGQGNNTIGSGGYNGGGAGGLSSAGTGSCLGGPAGGGGGASDIRVGGVALGNRMIVGGGGGGAGRDYCNGSCLPCGCGGSGGAGGGLLGVIGGTANTCNGGNYNGGGVNGGLGGTATAGGAGGIQDPTGGTNSGTAGVVGVGGNGSLGQYDVAGGGGGGGYFGGGGGGGAGNGTGVGGGGGGGGSSYLSGVSGGATTPAFQSGDGVVILSYNYNGALAAVANSPSLICTGSSSTLTAASGQVSYTWTPGGSNSNSIIVSPTTTTSYTVQGTNGLGCISSAVVSVIVNTGVPSLSVVSTATGVCLGKTVIFTASGANTYTWSNGITNGATYTPAATSTYVVTGENACGTSTAAISMSVNPIPLITASINNPTVCSGGTIILNGGGGTTSYTWNPGVPNNTPFVPPNTTNYTVTGGSANGCTATAVTGVTVLITPNVPPVVTPTAMCLGQTATLSAVGATGYTWTPGSNLTAATVTVSPPIPTTYTLFRTNGACSSTSTVNLVIYPLPLVNATGSPNQICAGTGVNLVVVGPITNTWLPGGFTIANFTVFPNFSITYTVTGSNGNCTATAVVPVTVSPTPTITISTSTLTICQGQSVTLTGGGALSYTWYPMNTNNQVEVVSPMATTLYTLTGENSFSCTTSINQVIVVNPLPDMNLTSNLPYICAGNTASLSITSPTPNIVYSWSTGPTGTSILVSPTITTNYFATGINTITGCQNTNTISLAVYISTFAVSGPTAICKGQAAIFSAAGDATTYNWTANGGPIGTGVPSVTVSPIVNTTYYVVGTNASCTSTVSVPLIVNPIPNVTALVATSPICRFEVSTIAGNGATSYSWNTGASTPTISFTLSVTTTYTLTGTDINGCAKTVTVTQFVATCIGLEDFPLKDDVGLNVYPNPNNGNFIISSNLNITLNIVNALGQAVSIIKLTEDNQKEVTVSNLTDGIYFITGQASGLKVNKKIIIAR